MAEVDVIRTLMHTTDTIRLLSKGSLHKVYHASLLYGSYQLSRLFRKNLHAGLPIAASFEPTTHCNLRCPECPSGLRSFTRDTGSADLSAYQNLIDELAPHLWYLILYFQGEPFLHPHFLDLVRYAHSKKIYTATSTNAHYITPEKAREIIDSGLDRLIISIDGTDQKTYENYRVGGSLEKVIEGTKNILEARKKDRSKGPHIVFQFLVVKQNEHQIPEVKKLAKELGVDDVWLKTAQIYDYQNGSPLIPDQEKYSRYKKDNNGTYSIKYSKEKGCWKMWHSCVFTWDKKVVPCCFDKDAHHVMGDQNEIGFKKIWKGAPYRKFRDTLMKSRSQVEMCKNCSEGVKVFSS
jgi:MoaA/NifB/PqqE/SkfB family radical SAM enzyme